MDIVALRSAPIKKLPFDLLHEIFWQAHMDIFDPTRLDNLIFGIPYVEQFFPDGRPDGVPAWTLSQVCRTWRELVINSPRLWAHVAFLLPAERVHWTIRPVPHQDVSDQKHNKSYVGSNILFRQSLQLERSKDHSLNIILVLHQPFSHDHFNEITCLHPLLQSFPRCTHLYLSLNPRRYENDYGIEEFDNLTTLSPHFSDLLNLHHLSFFCDHEAKDAGSMKRLPALRSLATYLHMTDSSGFLPTESWAHGKLESFRLPAHAVDDEYIPSLSSSYNIISYCVANMAALTRLSLVSYGNTEMPNEVTELSQLQHLVVKVYLNMPEEEGGPALPPLRVSGILGCLAAPRLEDLEVLVKVLDRYPLEPDVVEEVGDDKVLESIVGLCKRSECSLESLRLTILSEPEETPDFESLHKVCPSLKDLELEWPSQEVTLITILRDFPQTAFKHLRSLMLTPNVLNGSGVGRIVRKVKKVRPSLKVKEKKEVKECTTEGDLAAAYPQLYDPNFAASDISDYSD
jgi:hypothetical protein